METLQPVRQCVECTTFLVEEESGKLAVKLYFIKQLGLSQWFYQKRLKLLQRTLNSLSAVSHKSLPVYRFDRRFEPKAVFGADLYYTRVYIEGTPLNELFPHNKEQPPNIVEQNAWKLLRDLSDALLYLQRIGEKGLCHGNIKPQNIILASDGTYIFTDVGIYPHFLTNVMDQTSIYSSIRISQFYQPREFRTTVEITTSFDIWSLGCVLCEFLAGESLCANRMQSSNMNILTVSTFPYSSAMLHLVQWMLAIEQSMRIELNDLAAIANKGAELFLLPESINISSQLDDFCAMISRKKNLVGIISAFWIKPIENKPQEDAPEYLLEERDEVVHQTIDSVNRHKRLRIIQPDLLTKPVISNNVESNAHLHMLISQLNKKDFYIEQLNAELVNTKSALASANERIEIMGIDIKRLEEAYLRLSNTQSREPGVHPAYVSKLLVEKTYYEKQAIEERKSSQRALESANTTIKQLQIILGSREDALDAAVAELTALKQELNSQNSAFLRDKMLTDLQNAIMNAESEKSTLRREILAAKRDIKALILVHNESNQSIINVEEQLKLEQEQSQKLQERCKQLEKALNIEAQEPPVDYIIDKSFLEEKVSTLEIENERIIKEISALRTINKHVLPPPPPYLEMDAEMHLVAHSNKFNQWRTECFLKKFKPLLQNVDTTKKHGDTNKEIDPTSFIIDPRLIPVPVLVYHELSDESELNTFYGIDYTLCGAPYRMLYDDML